MHISIATSNGYYQDIIIIIIVHFTYKQQGRILTLSRSMYYKNFLAQMVDNDVIVLMKSSDFQRKLCYF